MDDQPPAPELQSARRVALIYLAVAVLWITATGVFLEALLPLEARLSASLLVGTFFVVGSTGLVYLLIRREMRLRSRAEQAVKETFENIPVGLFRITQEGRFIEVNKALTDLLGYDYEELAGLRSTDTVLEGYDREAWLRRVRQDEVVSQVQKLRRKNGEVIWVEEVARGVRDGEGELLYIDGSLTDITERISVQNELAASRHFLRMVIQTAPQSIITTDLQGRVADIWNDAATRMFGWSHEEVRGQVPPFVAEGDLDEFRERVERITGGEQVTGAEIERSRRDGSRIRLRISATALRSPEGETEGVLSIGEDVTEVRRRESERLRLEEELKQQRLQAERLESLARLTGAIAHDFNNLLTVIGTNADLLQDEVGDDDGRIALQELRDAVGKAGEVVRRLVVFSHREDGAGNELDLRALILDQAEAIRPLVSSGVKIEVESDVEVPTIRGEPDAIGYAVTNVVSNAADALPEGGTVRLSMEVVPDDTIEPLPGLDPPAQWIRLRIEDDGSGMHPDVLDRAMDPFFSTKEPHKAAGLGLAMVYGVMRRHLGRVLIESSEGKGTTVDLFFPIGTQRARSPKEEGNPKGGSERIWIVDDEPGVRRALVKQLEKLGYEVESFESGEAALEKLDGGAPVDLLITDIVMPEMSGEDLYIATQERRPDLPVLFISGWSAKDFVGSEDVQAEVPMLAKPWTLDELAGMIRDQLGT